MEVNRLTCQQCQSIDVRNIIVRDEGEQIIFVRCAKCKELVARYQLKDYYHHHTGFESYLRAHSTGSNDSGRAWLQAFRESQDKAVTDYDKAIQILESENKEI